MTSASTLTELIEGNRNAARSITYLEGENEERVVTYGAYGITDSARVAPMTPAERPAKP